MQMDRPWPFRVEAQDLPDLWDVFVKVHDPFPIRLACCPPCLAGGDSPPNILEEGGKKSAFKLYWVLWDVLHAICTFWSMLIEGWCRRQRWPDPGDLPPVRYSSQVWHSRDCQKRFLPVILISCLSSKWQLFRELWSQFLPMHLLVGPQNARSERLGTKGALQLYGNVNQTFGP